MADFEDHMRRSYMNNFRKSLFLYLTEWYFAPHFLVEYFYTSPRSRNGPLGNLQYVDSLFIRLMSTLIFCLPAGWSISFNILLSGSRVFDGDQAFIIIIIVMSILWRLDYFIFYKRSLGLKARNRFTNYSKSRVFGYAAIWVSFASIAIYISLKI